MTSNFTARIRLIWILMAVIVVGYAARLYWLQVVDSRQYVLAADHQYASSGAGLFNRGSIFFTQKDGELIAAATLQSGFLLSINPSVIADPQGTYEKLSTVISLNKEDFLTKATKKGDMYEEIADRLDDATASKIQALALPGVNVSQEQWRYYPGGTLAAHALGFVGYQGNTLTGEYGLEQYYNNVLSRPDENAGQNIFVQIFSAAKSVINGENPMQQGDIITTIEPTVQATLVHELQQAKEQWKPTTIGGIVMNPENGEIYAMASFPTFNPNSYASVSDPSVYSDPLIADVYEMGSIMKPLTMAAGLDTGAITATTTYDDTGCITVDTAQVCNYDFRARGVIPMQQILSQSLNVGASWVATQLGPARMRDYFLNHYELGSTTGIDLPGEIGGITNNLQSPRQLEYDTASFGQGIAVTPIEMTRALSALANGGYLVTPHLVKAIRYDIGVTKNVEPTDKIRIIKPSTSEEVSRMLSIVYDDALDYGKVKMEHYTIATKTGTAQIAEPNGGGYYPDRYLHSFFGYFPAYNAKFIIFMYMVYPKNVEYASETLTTPFVDMAKFLINYYQLPPDR